jgi:hypothetical protein
MTILHNSIDSSTEDYNESNRKVLLHQHADSYSIAFTTASFTASSVKITRMDADSKPKTMRLSDIEVKALIVAWTAFKADIEQGTTEIIVNHGQFDHDTYKVSLPSLNWGYYSHQGTGYTIHSGTVLLEAIRKALGHIETEIRVAKVSSARPTWPSDFKTKYEGYIAAWDAAHDWLEEIKAEHFPKAKEEEETVSEKPAPWSVAPGLETTWTLHLTAQQ